MQLEEEPKPRVTVSDLGGEESEALKVRIERAQRQLSREIAETDDPAEAKRKVAEWRANEAKLQAAEEELKKYRDGDEKRKRAAMTEQQRIEADLKRAREENERLRTQLVEKETAIAHAQQNSSIDGVAKGLIDETWMEYAKYELAKHVKGLDKRQLERFGERDVRRFFEKLIKEKPQFKRQEPAPPEVVRKPINAGAPAPAPKPKPRTDSPGEVGGKTFKPGQSNSMSRSEVREQARKMGVRWPG